MIASSLMNSFALFFFALLSVVSASPVLKRDVFVPPVTYPHAGTVWFVGETRHVRWSTKDAPAQITNPNGTVVLSKGGLLDLANPLATNFSILAGEVKVVVPDVLSGDDYAIVLIGDSGNASPNFTITARQHSNPPHIVPL